MLQRYWIRKMLVCARDSIPVSQKKWKQYFLYISISRKLIFLPDNAFFVNLKFHENDRKTGFVKDNFFYQLRNNFPRDSESLMVLNNFFVSRNVNI